MKHIKSLISLMALLIVISSVHALYMQADNNQVTCVDYLINEGEAGVLIDTLNYSGGILNSASLTFTANNTNITGIVTAQITNLPCGTIIYCIGNYSIYNSTSYTEIINITKNCQTTTTTGTALTTLNYSSGTLPSGTGGTIPGADISGLETNILGLSKTHFFALASALIITIIMLSFKPSHLAIGISCVAMCVIILVMQWFTIPSSLIMIICIIGAIHFLSKT